MIFVIGGAFQGKTEFVMEQFHISGQDFMEGESCELDKIYNAKVINHFECLIKRLMQAEEESNQVIDKLINKNKNCIVISTEIGSGLVPIDKFERDYRENVGRMCCKIAKNSSSIFRVQCGIATKIYDNQKSENRNYSVPL